MDGKDRHQLIAVRYRNQREGLVDSITLNELMESKRISHFYRPSEDRWVDISVDPLRRREKTKVRGRISMRRNDLVVGGVDTPHARVTLP